MMNELFLLLFINPPHILLLGLYIISDFSFFRFEFSLRGLEILFWHPTAANTVSWKVKVCSVVGSDEEAVRVFLWKNVAAKRLLMDDINA